MKLNKKYLWNILLIVSLTIIAMYFSLKDHFAAIIKALGSMNKFVLVIVLCWGLLFTAVWGISYLFLGQKYKKDYTLLQGIIVAFVGTFFSGITPSATGGQFGQIYVLKKQGISYADGASLLWADFIIYQTTMMIYVTVLFALRFTHYANLSGWFWIVFAGYIVNLIVIIALYTIAIFPRFYVRLAEWVFKYLQKLKFFKKRQDLLPKLIDQINKFTVEIHNLSQDKSIIMKCMLVNFVRLTLHYTLPFVVARGLGIPLKLSLLVDVMALSSFVTMANSFIPLPGASGGTEFVFTLLFRRMFGVLTGAVLLLWRISSYYFPVIAGAVVFILFKNRYDQLKEEEQQAALKVQEKVVIEEKTSEKKPSSASVSDIKTHLQHS